MSNQEWKTQKMKQLVADIFSDSKMSSSDESILRHILFSHTPDTNEFWLQKVPKIIKKWAPERKQEVDNILNH